MPKSYYDILEISNESNQSEIREKYLLLSKKYHPDKNNNNHEKYQEINEAYSILSNEIKRKEYDELLKSIFNLINR